MITINQRDWLEWRPGMTVADVLATQRFTFPRVVVSVNGVVVPHDAYDRTPIPDKADVSVIHLMAGG